ncbi:probable G-protein coupled receptor Mth-like 3 [Drosophila subpulchrella]|uniref:probable G-protein coupled receptor Mth-like 3 n=1 Tax=Drosophila subpulchrella TaxID=1486046 RepID=UPI0018A13DB4|nr:probable G-protein coupled receptor Mth-like 3 [Drosophila subpulchrella]
MRLIFGSFVAVILLLTIKTTRAEIINCDFYDTVDISSGEKYPNGSYLYDGLLIPADWVAEYNFTLSPNGSKEFVPSYMRGCACKLRPCIRFCCPHNHKIRSGKCVGEMSIDELESHNRYVNVTLNNGTVAKRHFKEDLVVQSDLPLPCGDESMYELDHTKPGHGFTLFENGTIFRAWDSVYLNKAQYCVQHIEFQGDSIRIAPHFCRLETSKTGQSVVMIISLICMVLTISVYLYVKKLQNLHGKCFMCYMVALFMVYLLLLLDLWHFFTLPSTICTTSGFLGYFFVLAAFCWLSVISLHLWNTFSGPAHSLNRFLPEHRFLAYNSYAWGMALAMTGVTFLADKVIEDRDWAPRMGTTQCWIYTGDNVGLLYFYGPMLLLIVFNITMFILTAIRIVKVKKEVQNFTQQQRRTNKLNSDKRTYTFFLRLFIIMGLSWSLEIVSFLVSRDSFWRKVFVVADYLNWSQGTIIFVLFILKPSTLKLLKDRGQPKYTWSATTTKSREG